MDQVIEDERLAVQLYDDETAPVTAPQSKSRNSSIENDLKKLNLPDQLKRRAAEIHESIGSPMYRGRNRKIMVVGCLYEASKETTPVVLPTELLKATGCTNPELIRASNLYFCAKTSAQKKLYTQETCQDSSISEVSEEDPTEYIDSVGSTLGIEHTVLTNIKKLILKDISKLQTLRGLSPLVVAAAGIYHYMSQRAEPGLKKSEIASLLQIPPTQLNNVVKIFENS